MNIRRGEIYWVNLDPVIGSEIGKKRPVIIISNNKNNEFANTVNIIPLTSENLKKTYPHEVLITKGDGNLEKNSKAKCDQIRTIDKKRLLGLIGEINKDTLKRIEIAIKIQFDLMTQNDRLDSIPSLL